MIDMIKKLFYNPDYAVLPGATVAETLQNLCMKQAELAQRTGRPLKTINQIIRGKASITAETAIQFEKALGAPASFWLKLEQNYQERKARLKEEDEMRAQFKWLTELPLRSMIQYSWLKRHGDKYLQLQEVLKFFGVVHFKQIQITPTGSVAFRKSTKSKINKWALAAWLRKGEIDAKNVDCNAYNKSIFNAKLNEIRSLTRDDKDVKTWGKIIDICSRCGVALVFVRELPGLPVNGATYWLKDKPVIQLSLRYKKNDILWFSFFHEVGHILKHGKKDVFVEISNVNILKEREADKFASEFLIPEKIYNGYISKGEFTEESIKKFADTLGIASGIVVGRLQHDSILQYNQFNGLKTGLRWS